MKKCFLFIAFFSIFLAPSYCHQYDLVICAIFCEDDLPYMKEWIDFHEKQGVQHIYLYNHLGNRSNIDAHLKNHIDSNFVEIKDWPYRFNNCQEWNRIQQNAYMDCMKQIKETCKWCAIIDSDEFLFSPLYGNLVSALDNYNDYSGVVVNWVCYGTSNHCLLPGQKLTDHLVYRQKLVPGTQTTIKSIVKPNYVTGGFIHRFDYSSSFAVNEKFQRIDGFVSPLSCERFRINHYWSRDLTFFLNIKIPRRLNWDSNDTVILIEKTLNVEYDDIAKKFN